MVRLQERKGLLVSFVLLVLLVLQQSEAKRYSSSSGRRSSSSSSSNTRRTSLSSHSTSGHVTKPSYSNSDLTRLSYSNSHSQPVRPSSVSSTHTQPYKPANTYSGASSATARPIGWNVPSKQGPPPAYSATNPAGGARTNIHEPSPAYRPSAPPAPSYSSNSAARPASTANTYRPRNNSTGFGSFTPARTYQPNTFGSGGSHTPVTASRVNNVQSNYPRQQVPAGATYYPAGSSLPAGAAYHPSGSLPAGATYHSPGHLPAGATYHPSGSIPAGATYYPHGAAPGGYHPPAGGYHPPPGATYYPAGGAPAGASYYPSAGAVPAGATFLSAGSALPAGATYYAQPPKSSSGLGFGSGLAAGALGGALLGHVLTPTHTKVIEHAPSYSGGGGGGVSGAANDDKIIIINNGPPGSVTTTNAGPGTTVINTGADAGAAYQPPAQLAPMAPASGNFDVSGAPNVGNNYNAGVPSGNVAAAGGGGAAATVAGAAAAGVGAINAPTPMDAALGNAGSVNSAPVAAAGSGIGAPIADGNPIGTANGNSAAEQPPAGGIICVPVRVPEPDPNDSTKTIEVEKVACYPAPPPETSTPETVSAGSTESNAMMSTSEMPATASTVSNTASVAHLAPFEAPLIMTKNSAPLQSAETTPLRVPEGFVALAPIYPSLKPELMKLPGNYFVEQRVQRSVPSTSSNSAQVASRSNSATLNTFSSTLIIALFAVLFY